jgi:predicted dienelactone hydrolase
MSKVLAGLAALFAALMMMVPRGAAAAPTDYAAKGTHPVAVLQGDWTDTRRQRTVPWLIRYPSDLTGPAPVVVFSHGLGGSRSGAAYYGDHLASHGYVVVYVQHPGSDVGIFEGKGLSREAANQSLSPRATLDRFFDIPFALDQLTAMDAAPGPLQGRLDLARIGMSGHSFGAVTTEVMAGQVFPNGSLPEPRFKAFLAMSPSQDRQGNNARAFSRITQPFLFLTGTQDEAQVGPRALEAADQRAKPFEAIEGVPETLVVLTGGDHMVFSGREEMGMSRPKDGRFHAIVQAASLAFWDAYLRDDPAAQHWLRDGGLAAYAGADATVKSKGPAKR